MENLGQPTFYYYFLPATLVDCLNKYKSGESSLLLISSITSLKSLRLRDVLTFGYLWLPFLALLSLSRPYLALLRLTMP